MEKILQFEDLTVWRKAHSIVLDIYKMTKCFPSEEKYGLISQMRRAAVSVPANISEGFKKKSIKDKINFYNIAQGSLNELRYYTILSNDLNYVQIENNLENTINEVGKMLNALITSLSNKNKVVR